jgi:signal peptidase II
MVMKRLAMIFLLLLVCIGCDQSTKYTAKQFLEGKQALSYMGDTFRLTYTENRGAFLGFGAGVPEKLRFSILILLALALFGFLLFIICSKRLNTLAVFSAVLIIGGGFSNLIDRILNKGSVIDFINMGLGPIRTGIFNLADLAILGGGLMFAAYFAKTPHGKANRSDF